MEAVHQPAPLAGEHEDWLHRLGVSLSASKWSESLQGIVGKLALNTPLDLEDGVVLFNHPDLHELGALANAPSSCRSGWLNNTTPSSRSKGVFNASLPTMPCSDSDHFEALKETPSR